MNKPTAIVVIGYNRPNSLERLLGSINKADYSTKDISLVISIDFSERNNEVLKVANNFEWNFGTKEVIQHTENLGLKRHVLACGDLTAHYGSIIMLEDDLYVSPNFYNYAEKALEFCENQNKVAGISLYNHPLNVHTNEVFNAIEDGYDNYYFQFASSWGQAWTVRQWNNFKKWHENNQEIKPANDIPKNVSDWSAKSWLKFYTVYLIRTNQYFLYPKISLSTNFSDAGTHVGSDTTSYQSKLNYAKKCSYRFSTFKVSESVYDSFYENVNLFKSLKFESTDLCVDLYGYKPAPKTKFWLSSQIVDFEFTQSYTRSLKPIDANITERLLGDDFYLYDTTKPKVNQKKYKKYRRISYNIGHLSFKNSLAVTLKLLAMKIRTKFGSKH